MITFKLAEEIVKQTMVRLRHNINVISVEGVILASGDKQRVEKIHEGAKEVVKTKKPLIITEENLHLYPHTKPGINLPIFFQDEIVCVIGITGESEELKSIANLVQLTTEVIVHQALLESQSEWQRKMSDLIFDELIVGSPIKGVLKERIDKLEFQLLPPLYVIIIKAKRKNASYRTLIQYLEDFYFKQPILYGHYQLDEYYILSTQTNENALKRMLQLLNEFLRKQFDIHIGVSKVANSIEEIPGSYRTAKLAIQHSKTDSTLTYFEDIEVLSLFNSDEVTSFSGKILQKLDQKLVETVTSLLNHKLQISQTAEHLNIHRHTLTYRIQQIKEKTKLNPLDFHDAIKFQIALWYHKK